MQRKPDASRNAPDAANAADARPRVMQEPGSKYRVNPEVEADLSRWRERNPAQVEYVRDMPRERLENSYFLRLMRAERQREAAREAIAARFMADEPLLQQYMVRAQKLASKMKLGAGGEAEIKAAALDLFLGDRRSNAITARKLGRGQQQAATGEQPSPSSRMRP